MDQVQQILVADHIHDLEHEAAALRAERARDVVAAPRATGTGPRRRLGRWLIGVGEAIAGRSPESVGDCGDPMASPV
jgi:hypothetical protein